MQLVFCLYLRRVNASSNSIHRPTAFSRSDHSVRSAGRPLWSLTPAGSAFLRRGYTECDVVAGDGLTVITADDQSVGAQHLQIIRNALIMYKSSAHRDDLLATEHCSKLSPYQYPFVEISDRRIDRKSPTQLTVRSYI